MQTITLKHK